jgi:hypothetical protein
MMAIRKAKCIYCINFLFQVKYLEGTAKIADIQDIVVTTDITPILTCLQTKWPTVELHWKNNVVPSMN